MLWEFLGVDLAVECFGVAHASLVLSAETVGTFSSPWIMNVVKQTLSALMVDNATTLSGDLLSCPMVSLLEQTSGYICMGKINMQL